MSSKVKIKVIRGPNGFLFHHLAPLASKIPPDPLPPEKQIRNVGRWRATTFRIFHDLNYGFGWPGQRTIREQQ
jgi:hypothetical protein